MKKPRSQEDIISSWQCSAGKPVVTICCITYNHELYIQDCIEGFLIQETDFPFEILIHDDASTDNTAKIIASYAQKYPKIIKPMYQNENQYSKGKRAMEYLMPLCRGDYIALCEGDDYWIDPKKLQIQVDFLDNNPEYVISGHDAFVVDEQGNKIKNSHLSDYHKRDYSKEELIKGHAWILTMSWVYRNVIKEYIYERAMVKNGDRFFTSLIGHYGKSKYHSDIIPACYRVHRGGVWSSLSHQEQTISRLNTYVWLYYYYSRIGSDKYKNYYYNKIFIVPVTSIPNKVLTVEFLKRVLMLRKLKSITKFIRF